MERDDLIKDHEYSLLANHDEEHGKEIRKKIWKVTAILTAITIAEVITGASIKQYYSGVANDFWWIIKVSFIALTVVKAAYIVLIFMHLGDEIRNMIMTIVVPLLLFVWFIAAFIWDGNSYKNLRNKYDAHYKESTMPTKH